MKAYLYIENNPYYQDQTIPHETDINYDEADLLPDDFPQEYLNMFQGKVVFHAHRFMELLRIVKGRALYIVDKNLCFVNPGDIIFFNAFVPHSWLLLDEDVLINDYSFSNMLQTDANGNRNMLLDNGGQNLRLNIWHTKPNADQTPLIISSNEFSMREDFMMNLINSSLRYVHIKHNTPECDIFTKILNSIENEVQNRNFAFEYILHAKLMELVANLFRIHSDNRMKTAQKQPALLISALNYISENLHHNLHLDMVAKHCFLTPQYFSAYFKKHTGMNFSKYLIDIRLERAMKELIESDDSILEIVYRCGFNSKTSFYRAWYSKYQISPSKLRDMHNPQK